MSCFLLDLLEGALGSLAVACICDELGIDRPRALETVTLPSSVSRAKQQPAKKAGGLANDNNAKGGRHKSLTMFFKKVAQSPAPPALP